MEEFLVVATMSLSYEEGDFIPMGIATLCETEQQANNMVGKGFVTYTAEIQVNPHNGKLMPRVIGVWAGE